jgi:GNAT superfamily N-acetyltransferase
MPPSSEFSIRAATESDIPTILRLVRGLAEYERLAHTVTATEASLRESLFERPAAEAVIGWLGDEPVGLAVYFQTYSTFLGRAGLYLEDLFVEPEYRGRGFGKRLLAYTASVAVARGCPRLDWSVLVWNEPSIQFYRSLGATSLDDWRTFRLAGEALAQLAADQGPRR